MARLCGRPCGEHDLEGVVAKRRSGRYMPARSGWIKTKNRDYWRYEMECEGGDARSRRPRAFAESCLDELTPAQAKRYERAFRRIV